MARDKLLAPNGKMYTEAQLDRLNMKQVFDHLIDLGVADKALYNDFKGETRRPRTRTRRRPSPRVRYVYRSPVRRYRSPPRLYLPVYGRRSPPRVRTTRATLPYPTPAIPSPRSGCQRHPTALTCRNAGCYWSGVRCITP